MAEVWFRQQAQKIGHIRRGDIYLVCFDPTVGHEIKKTRPALIIQNDIGNRYSSLTIAAAITSKVPAVPSPVEVVLAPSETNGLDVRSAIRVDQIRTIDRRRLIKRLGLADDETMAKVDRAIKVSLGLVEL
jgi:mRNA interferase MazF